MNDKILKAIDLYVNEPQGFIRAIPDPEVLAEFISEALREEV